MSPSARAAKKSSDRSPALVPSLRLVFRGVGFLAPSLAARLASVLFRFPPRHRTSEPERGVLREGRFHSLNTEAGHVATWRWGSGPTVFLVHGWGSRGARLRSFVEPIVAAGCTAVAFDAPGHGDSPGRFSSLPQFIEAVSAVAAANGPVRGIVAHSMGSAAAALAMARGLSVERAVFLAPSAHPATYSRIFSERLAISPDVRQRMEHRIEQRFGFRWDEFAVLPRVSTLSAPLLVFHDRDDTDVPWSDGEAIARAWPGAQLVTTEGLGHRRIVHDPEVVSRAISFLFDEVALQTGVRP